jgi:hypothetical protein
MDDKREEAEQLSCIHSALAFFKQTSDGKSIAFVSVDTGVYI